MGRPKSRNGDYERISLEVRKDILDFIDSQEKNRREVIEDWGEKAMEAVSKAFDSALEAFLVSGDFKEGVVSATKASWGGSGYSVELFEDGFYRVLWNNQIGNRYQSEGVILALPTITDDGTYQKAVNGENAMSEDDYFDLAFASEEDDLKTALREQL